jgi:hypothetical protein
MMMWFECEESLNNVREGTDLILASCSTTLWLFKSSRENVEALGVARLALTAPCNNFVMRTGSPLRALFSAAIVVFRSMFFPLYGRKLWFAKVFSPGQGL